MGTSPCVRGDPDGNWPEARMAQERESCSFPGASLPPSWGWCPTPSQGLNSQCKIHIHEVSWPEVSNFPFQTCGYSPSKSIQIQRKDPRCCRRRQKEETSLPFLPRASMLTQPVCPCRKKEQHPAQTSCASAGSSLGALTVLHAA